MNNDRELLQQALDALEQCYDVYAYPANGTTTQDDAIRAIQARLAQPEPEPVAWRFKIHNEMYRKNVWHLRPHKVTAEDAEIQPLYTAPPQRIWQGLTDEEVVNRANAEVFAEAFARGVAWAELKLKEKNT